MTIVTRKAGRPHGRPIRRKAARRAASGIVRAIPCGRPGGAARSPCFPTCNPSYKKAALLWWLGFSPLENTGGGVSSTCSSLPSWAACAGDQTFSGLSGISIVLNAAEEQARVQHRIDYRRWRTRMQPASPTPFAPSGLCGEGVSTPSVIMPGICCALGNA